jgi:hypothetical protein
LIWPSSENSKYNLNVHQIAAKFMPHLLSEWKVNDVNTRHDLYESLERGPKFLFKDNRR